MKLSYLFARYLSLLCLPPTVSSQSQPRAPLLAPLKARKKGGEKYNEDAALNN